MNLAINKYGWENIQHNILEIGLTEEEAKKEKYIILKNIKQIIWSTDTIGPLEETPY